MIILRIISGKYKGKNILGFNINGTRPTMDRVKESLFGMIQNKIDNSICLDLFAGSGSLGIEALSNGAKKCIFVDNGKEVLKVLEKNLVGIDNAILIKDDYLKALNKINDKIDIIFLDPPYSLNLINKSIDEILKKDLLSDNGIIVCEYESEIIDCNLEIIKEKKYGNKFIRIYKKMSLE